MDARDSHTVGDDVVVPREADSFPYKVSGEIIHRRCAAAPLACIRDLISQ
jgi:hypothetical protein